MTDTLYHIIRHPCGGWAIKKGGSKRAMKRFPKDGEDSLIAALCYALRRGYRPYALHRTDGTMAWIFGGNNAGRS